MQQEELEKKLKAMLRPKRFEHSLRVRDMAVELAKKWGEDTQRVAVAGLLHDCAKHISEERSIKLIKQMDDKIDRVVYAQKGLWHAPLGAEIAKNEFGIDDSGIYDAIFYHTIGKPNMALLTKIIYIADMIEPGRDVEFKFVPELRRMAFENLDKAIIKCIDYTINSIISRGLLLHTGTVEARNSLILEVTER